MAKEELKYYVYHLIDPRNGLVFYVGKGCGDRISSHERDAALLKFLNAGKEETIHQIWGAGLKVQRVIVRRFHSEAMAYAFEKVEIERIGIENLTNISNGGEPAAKKALKRGEHFIARLQKMMHSLPKNKEARARQLIEEMEENLSYCKAELGIS